MSKPRKKPGNTEEMAAWFDLWVVEQALTAGRVNQLERRVEGLTADVDAMTALLMSSRFSHLPPEVFNPKPDAPVQPPAVRG